MAMANSLVTDRMTAWPMANSLVYSNNGDRSSLMACVLSFHKTPSTSASVAATVSLSMPQAMHCPLPPHRRAALHRTAPQARWDSCAHWGWKR